MSCFQLYELLSSGVLRFGEARWSIKVADVIRSMQQHGAPALNKGHPREVDKFTVFDGHLPEAPSHLEIKQSTG